MLSFLSMSIHSTIEIGNQKFSRAQPRIERGTCHICKSIAELSPEATTEKLSDSFNYFGIFYLLIPLDH